MSAHIKPYMLYIYRDCLFTTAVNSFTSIFSGFVVFSYLGYMADRQSKHISEVAQEGKKAGNQ